MRLRTALLAATLLATTPAFAQPIIATGQPVAGFADLVEQLSPAVVNISTTQKVKTGGVQMFGMPGLEGLPNSPEMEPFRDFFERFGQMQGMAPQEREVTSLGSGVIIESNGYVVTNNHVIADADEITVTLPNNDKYKATVIGRDKKTDLALLKVDAKAPLPSVSFGDSDVLRVGDWVIAIGNPFGLGGSVTQGIISARQRSINAGPFDDFLQTDAPINRGNSGGPLFNMKGEVIGINTAIFSPTGGSVGIGFAIPSSLAKPIIEQLKEHGRTHRGWLGVKIQEVSDEMADSLGMTKAVGALILEVSDGGPAQKAGIQPGDVITHFGGKEITEMRFLPRIVAETKIGSDAEIRYIRKGKTLTSSIRVGELDEEAEQAEASQSPKEKSGKQAGAESFLGMSLTPLTPALRSELQLGREMTGVVISAITNDSPALKRGLRRGDVISAVNSEAVASAADVRAQFKRAKDAGRKFAMVKVVRGTTMVFVTLPVDESK